MLNTALHNPNVKKKITSEQFVAQNRGINSGKDLPRDILVKLHISIKVAIVFLCLSYLHMYVRYVPFDGK